MEYVKKYWIVALLAVVAVWTYSNYNRAYEQTYNPCMARGGTHETCHCFASAWQSGFSTVEYVPFVSALTGASSGQRRENVQTQAENACFRS